MKAAGLWAVPGALPADPSLADVTLFLGTGLLVVLITLLFLSICCAGAARAAALFSRPAPAAAPAAETRDMSEETLAVIAAAAAVSLQTEHRILHIRQLTTGDWNWSMEGRMQHHASHRPREP